MTGTPVLLSIGTAVPDALLSQSDAAAHASLVRAATADPATSGGSKPRALKALYSRAGIESRGTVLGSERADLEMFFPPDEAAAPSTAARLDRYRDHAGSLAIRATRRALAEAGLGSDAITHLVTVSCTGFDAPGVDHELIRALGFPATIRRTHVGFMGCHAAINAMAVAAAFAGQDPSHTVLVCCVELCSLHFSYDRDPERCVANALFADGAAAAVISGSATPRERPAIRLSGFASTVLPNTSDLMSWSIGDHGFAMRLSPRVPDRLADAVPAWIGAFLDRSGLDTGAVRSWAVHPGGPRVLSAVGESLGLGADGTRVAREILSSHGNMSSATVLFIIERLIREAGADASPLVAMAFGPGLAGEAMLLTGDDQG